MKTVIGTGRWEGWELTLDSASRIVGVKFPKKLREDASTERKSDFTAVQTDKEPDCLPPVFPRGYRATVRPEDAFARRR